jgi:hypothetical protein
LEYFLFLWKLVLKVDDNLYFRIDKWFWFFKWKLDIKYKGLEDDEIEDICKELEDVK